MTAEATDASGSSEEMKEGGSFGIGVRGFIGAEYFFAPKMSLSGEFGWGISLNSQGDGEYTTSGGGQSNTTKYGKNSSFGIDTDNVGGNISLNMYF